MGYHPLMNPAPTISPKSSQSQYKFDILILCGDDHNLLLLKEAVAHSFPQCPLKVVKSPSKLKSLTSSNLPLLFLADYHTLKPNGLELLKQFRQFTPNAWLCLVTKELELALAFENFGAFVDDIMPLDDQFTITLKNSLNRIFIELEPELPGIASFNTKTIPVNLFLKAIHDSLIVADGDGRLLYANNSWNEIFPDPTIERTYLSDIIHPNDLHRLEADLQLAILENGCSNSVFRVKAKLDRWETLHANITGFESEGIHVAFISTKLVTELHRLQTRLQELEMQNVLYQHNIDSVVYRYNLNSRNLQFITEAPLARYGYSSEDFSDHKAMLYEKLVHPDELQSFQSFLENTTRRGSTFSQETSCKHSLVRKDGKLQDVEHSIRLDWSRDGSQFWINGAIRDIVNTPEPNSQPISAENNLTLLFEAMLEGMAEFEINEGNDIKSRGLKCISCNHAFVNLTATHKSQLLGSLLCDLFPGLDETPLNIDSEESLPQVLEYVALGGEPRTIDDYFWPHLRSYFNISATSIRPGNVLLMLTDVTRRKHAEIRLATLLRGLPDTALYQTGGGVEYISEGIAQMLGYPPEIFQQDRNFFVSLIHPDDREHLMKAQNRWISKGSRRVLEMEFRAKHREGHYIWILDRMSKAFTTPDGKQSSQGVMIDITARKQLETERQIEVAEMEAVFKTLPELQFRLDKNGVILNYRAGHEDLLYLKPEEFLNKSMLELLPINVAAKFKKAMLSTFKTRNQSTLEYTLEVPAGKLKFRARLFYLSDELISIVVQQK